jgi:hypothetical protein
MRRGRTCLSLTGGDPAFALGTAKRPNARDEIGRYFQSLCDYRATSRPAYRKRQVPK